MDWDSDTTIYVYDVAGQLVETQLPSGVISGYEYNDAGWRTCELRLLDVNKHSPKTTQRMTPYLGPSAGILIL